MECFMQNQNTNLYQQIDKNQLKLTYFFLLKFVVNYRVNNNLNK